MDMINISSENRHLINDFISTHWYSTDIVVRGELVDMTSIAGFAMIEKENIIGLITYRIIDRECEIMSIDSLKEKQGIGSLLIQKIKEVAINQKCTKLKLITTNDNIDAIYFYQRRGFDMVTFYYDSIKASRILKPSIPELGYHNIPLKHEIEFAMNLNI